MPSPKKFTDEELIAAMREHGSQRKAAAALGVRQSAISRRLQLLQLRGFSPQHQMPHALPDLYVAKRVSTLRDAQGNVRAQWLIGAPDQDKVRAFFDAAAKALCEEIPKAEPVPAPRHTEDRLLNCYVVTDYHLGMLSWHEETGADWDTQIAEDTLVRWFYRAIATSPAAKVGVLAQLGDFLHFDGLDTVTPTSKHVLDADTRFVKLVRVAIRVLRRVIALLLSKHAEVRVLMAEGNHDIASSVWLRELMAAMYHNDPRVTVDTNPDPYYCVEWGKTALFFHHGHKRKPANVDTVFAAKFREVFGRTQHAYAHMGHLHHVDQRETNLMIVEQHRTLAAPDAFASRGGWMSGRDAQVITYDTEFGEVARLKVNYQMVEGAR